jgi:hypothetical protein
MYSDNSQIYIHSVDFTLELKTYMSNLLVISTEYFTESQTE